MPTGRTAAANSRRTNYVVRMSDEEKRRADLAEAMEVMASPAGLGLTVDLEDARLMTDAMTCYIYGADTATVFCVHAACERDLASSLHNSDSTPVNSKMWGLGKLISHYRAGGWIPDDLLERLDNLNEYRKILYHFGHSASDNALLRRTYDLVERVGPGNVRREYKELHGHDGGNKEILSFALDQVRQETALEALTTGLMFRSWVAEQSGF